MLLFVYLLAQIFVETHILIYHSILACDKLCTICVCQKSSVLYRLTTNHPWSMDLI